MSLSRNPAGGARNFANDGQGYRTVKGGSRIGLARDLDPLMARSVALDPREQYRGIPGVQPCEAAAPNRNN
jgi:hypothetical protein